MIQVVKYNNNFLDQWEEFVLQSNNGTIFQLQTFLSYHISKKIQDSSLIFLRKGKIIAVLPGAIKNKNNFFSHPGASFGGIVYNKLSYNESVAILQAFHQFCRDNKINQITMIPSPPVYHNLYDQTLDYAMLKEGYAAKESYFSSIIQINNDIDTQIESITSNKGRGVNYYNEIINQHNLELIWENDFEKFYPILVENKKIHHSMPTHTEEELKAIDQLLPNRLNLLVIKKNNTVIGGTLIFTANLNTGIIFYNMIDYEYKNLQIATIQILESIKWARNMNLNFLDFGVSHIEENGDPTVPKLSLIKFKEEFNAFGQIRTIYNKTL